MHAATALLALAGAASASPVAARKGPIFPDTVLSPAFKLVVNVTDLTKDFNPPIHNTFITSIHVGAGLNYVGNVADEKAARTFYTNGTYTSPHAGSLTTVSDGGTPPAPYSFSLTPTDTENVSLVHLDAGVGTRMVALSQFPEPFSFIAPDTFVACNEPLAYYGNKKFIIIKQAKLSVEDDGTINRNIPKGCAPIRLIPQTAPLNELPEGSISSHDHVLTSRTYKDVKSIDWRKYGNY